MDKSANMMDKSASRVATHPKPASRYPRVPESRIGRFIWAWRMWFYSTFALNMLEPWENALLLTIFLAITVTFWWSVINFYPKHIAYLSRRFSYYVFEDENVNAIMVFRHWVGRGIGRAWNTLRGAGEKEL